MQQTTNTAFISQVEQIAIPASPTTTVTAQQPSTEVTTNKAIYVGKTAEQIFAMFGGEQTRGAISGAMRAMTAAGFKRGEIAKMLNKRYQHVKNVMDEAARAKRPQVIPVPNAASVTLPTAANVAEALTKIHETTPQLIKADSELAEKIRQERQVPTDEALEAELQRATAEKEQMNISKGDDDDDVPEEDELDDELDDDINTEETEHKA